MAAGPEAGCAGVVGCGPEQAAVNTNVLTAAAASQRLSLIDVLLYVSSFVAVLVSLARRPRAAGPLNPGLTSVDDVRPGSRRLKPAGSIPARNQFK
jgi:hypothetical protein